jgi:hypothetical protein
VSEAWPLRADDLVSCRALHDGQKHQSCRVILLQLMQRVIHNVRTIVIGTSSGCGTRGLCIRRKFANGTEQLVDRIGVVVMSPSYMLAATSRASQP